ncbi:hypothetical protein KI387_036988 [Taxus chinensis]|uniref:Homeobox domain-containing protein n=1 Tax=Taxus chinensis TaxID=29808 RepID=A0AA38FQQ4_TAXCH|nr:hypothetical protein KI387_036988 [Taxus chinensis]
MASWTALFKANSSTPTSHKPAEYEQRKEETKSRWNPKRQQIDILESIFKSGKANPTRKEIEAIKTELQQFGEVGDANIFYWFQNRKSRSKKRQRRLDRPAATEIAKPIANGSSSTHNIAYNATTPTSMGESSAALIPTDQYINMQAAASAAATGGGILSEDVMTSADNYSGAISSSVPQNYSTFLMSCEENSCPFNLDHLQYAALISSTLNDHNTATHGGSGGGVAKDEDEGSLTVFIDGVKYQVPRGPINVKASFGENAYLVDSWGQQILTNEGGFTFQALHNGATYHLLSMSRH